MKQETTSITPQDYRCRRIASKLDFIEYLLIILLVFAGTIMLAILCRGSEPAGQVETRCLVDSGIFVID